MITISHKVSIVICTYNRSFYLRKCLESLDEYMDNERIEVLVIDNNSTDDTSKLVQDYQNKFNNLKYFFEDKIGLSHARNKAIEDSSYDFIAYLDDDVKVSDTYIDRLLWVIDNYDFDCLGGMYFPWYLDKKPKWISDDFGKKEKLLDSIGVLDTEYVTGLNMVYPKEILKKIGGFPVELGMIGNNIGYGEEDYVQFQIRKNGGKVYFDPELIVLHAVQEFKLSLLWQIKSLYINSKANFIIHKNNENNLYLFFFLFKSITAAILKRIPYGIFKLIFKKGFYYQNFILEVITPIVTLLGRIVVLNTTKS